MKVLEAIIILIAMIIPFVAIKSHDITTYAYWSILTGIYLLYISIKRW